MSQSSWSVPATSPTAILRTERGRWRRAGCWISSLGLIFTVGDHAYSHGTAREFRDCYDPRWGRFKDWTGPSPGNHDYLTDKGLPYFDYFGVNAGPDRRGYYSYALGAWHIISLNSTIDAGKHSPQVEWLRKSTRRSSHALARWPIGISRSSAPDRTDRICGSPRACARSGARL